MVMITDQCVTVCQALSLDPVCPWSGSANTKTNTELWTTQPLHSSIAAHTDKKMARVGKGVSNRNMHDFSFLLGEKHNIHEYMITRLSCFTLTVKYITVRYTRDESYIFLQEKLMSLILFRSASLCCLIFVKSGMCLIAFGSFIVMVN